MIKRARKQGNFTTVYNEFVNDNRLSARAKGVMIWLLSKPDDWVIHRSTMYKAFKEGRNAVWNAFKELIEIGYVISVDAVDRDGSGQFKKKSKGYVVYEVSIHSPQFELLYPQAKEPCDQSSANGLLLNTDTDQVLNKNKQNTELRPNTEVKESDRFFLYLDEVGIDVAAQQTYLGIKEGKIVSVGILPEQLKQRLLDMGCRITANKKLYIPKQ